MTFKMVSKLGLRSPDKALYKLSLECPASLGVCRKTILKVEFSPASS
jgi:hypothetical protein